MTSWWWWRWWHDISCPNWCSSHVATVPLHWLSSRFFFRQVIRMISEQVGEENFRKGLVLYLNRFKYSNTVTEVSPFHSTQICSMISSFSLTRSFLLFVHHRLTQLDGISFWLLGFVEGIVRVVEIRCQRLHGQLHQTIRLSIGDDRADSSRTQVCSFSEEVLFERQGTESSRGTAVVGVDTDCDIQVEGDHEA